MTSRFNTTHWSVVLAAGGRTGGDARAALEELCTTYWRPLFAFVRRNGFDDESARDLTQGFFAQLLERNDLAGVDPARGRFRAYLLAAVKNFMAGERAREPANRGFLQRQIKTGAIHDLGALKAALVDSLLEERNRAARQAVDDIEARDPDLFHKRFGGNVRPIVGP